MPSLCDLQRDHTKRPATGTSGERRKSCEPRIGRTTETPRREFSGSPDAFRRRLSYGPRDPHDNFREDPMSSDHPNVDTVNRMTEAIFGQDHDTLAKIFTDDLVFHLRGAHPMVGDHAGLGGFLAVLGSFFEATNGQIELE